MAVRLAPVPATVTATPAASRDSRLQAVRRLDWRFLLTDPSLDRVGYLGAGADGLLSALRANSRSLRVLERGEAEVHEDTHSDECDLVVVQAPRRQELLRAAAALRPGGWLYCELPRSSRLRRPVADSLSPLRARAELESAGIQVVQAYWHHPDFESCTRVIPLSRASVLASLVSRAAGRPVSAILSLVPALDRRLPHVLGALGFFPHVSIVGRRRGEA